MVESWRSAEVGEVFVVSGDLDGDRDGDSNVARV